RGPQPRHRAVALGLARDRLRAEPALSRAGTDRRAIPRGRRAAGHQVRGSRGGRAERLERARPRGRALGASAGSRVPAGGNAHRQRDRAHQRRAGRGGGPEGMTALPLASVSFVESTGVQLIKALVIFGFVLGAVPMILLLERKLL